MVGVPSGFELGWVRKLTHAVASAIVGEEIILYTVQVSLHQSCLSVPTLLERAIFWQRQWQI